MKLARAARTLFTPIDNSSIVLFRIAFGLIALWEVTRYFRYDWITEYYIAPCFFFKYYGFAWVRPWPGNGMYVHYCALGFLAAAICAGFMYRIAATLFFLAFTYVFLVDQTNYLNHFYLVSLISFLLIFVPAQRALSVDAYLQPELRSDAAPAWALWLLRMQIGVAYFYGGVAKLSADWLHGEPMRHWLAEPTDFPIIGRSFSEEWAVGLFAYGGLLLDLLIVPGLLWRPTHKYAFTAAALFHLLNSRLFSIGIFPWFMLFATLLFFPPDMPRQIARKIFSRNATGQQRERALQRSDPHGPLTARQRLIVAACAIYALVQLVFPLRHLAYPGDVNWTEEGLRARLRHRGTACSRRAAGRAPRTTRAASGQPTDNEALPRPGRLTRCVYSPGTVIAILVRRAHFSTTYCAFSLNRSSYVALICATISAGLSNRLANNSARSS